MGGFISISLVVIQLTSSMHALLSLGNDAPAVQTLEIIPVITT